MDIYYDLEPREDIGVCMGKRNKARTHLDVCNGVLCDKALHNNFDLWLQYELFAAVKEDDFSFLNSVGAGELAIAIQQEYNVVKLAYPGSLGLAMVIKKRFREIAEGCIYKSLQQVFLNAKDSASQEDITLLDVSECDITNAEIKGLPELVMLMHPAYTGYDNGGIRYKTDSFFLECEFSLRSMQSSEINCIAGYYKFMNMMALANGARFSREFCGEVYDGARRDFVYKCTDAFMIYALFSSGYNKGESMSERLLDLSRKAIQAVRQDGMAEIGKMFSEVNFYEIN